MQTKCETPNRTARAQDGERLSRSCLFCRLFLAIDDELDDILIAETLDQMDDFLKVTEEMITYWQAGDAKAMNDLMQENLGDDEAMEEFYRSLLDDRNVALVVRVAAGAAVQQELRQLDVLVAFAFTFHLVDEPAESHQAEFHRLLG